jgi:hypothetical protein
MQFTVFATCFIMFSCLAYSLTLKMGAVHSADISAKFYQATQLYEVEITQIHIYMDTKVFFYYYLNSQVLRLLGISTGSEGFIC